MAVYDEVARGGPAMAEGSGQLTAADGRQDENQVPAAGWGVTGMCLKAAAPPDPGRRRQFLQCQWGGTDRMVGLTDDHGYFQCVEIRTGEASYFQLCYGPQSFPPEPDEQTLVDERPWSAFTFVPGRHGDVIFVQWQSKYVDLGTLRRNLARCGPWSRRRSGMVMLQST